MLPSLFGHKTVDKFGSWHAKQDEISPEKGPASQKYRYSYTGLKPNAFENSRITCKMD